ncbi:MAG: trimethylamine methyltransferase family protein, partial [Akkermansiaceae bacterium]
YETAFYEPALSDSDNVESWEEKGSTDMRQNAHKRWKTMLRDYEAPPKSIASILGGSPMDAHAFHEALVSM